MKSVWIYFSCFSDTFTFKSTTELEMLSLSLFLTCRISISDIEAANMLFNSKSLVYLIASEISTIRSSLYLILSSNLLFYSFERASSFSNEGETC